MTNPKAHVVYMNVVGEDEDEDEGEDRVFGVLEENGTYAVETDGGLILFVPEGDTVYVRAVSKHTEEYFNMNESCDVIVENYMVLRETEEKMQGEGGRSSRWVCLEDITHGEGGPRVCLSDKVDVGLLALSQSGTLKYALAYMLLRSL